MKKLLSICFLSILLAALSFTTQAQVSTNCCFWLENLQPSTLTGLSNAPDGSGQLVLNNTMNPAVVGHTDYYKVRFNNNCNLPANTRVSLDIKLYRNGILISEDPDILARYANLSVYTRWNDLTTSNTPGTVNCGQVSWFGGRLNNRGTCQYDAVHTNHCLGGYPGAMQVSNTYPWSSTSTAADGPFTIYSDGFDFFNLNFFENSENIIAITWNYDAPNGLSLVVGLRERTNGTENPEHIGNDQGNTIGGHGSCCGALLAQDSIHYLATSHFEKEVCDGSTFNYGRPVHTFDTEGDYLVVFGDSTCDHFRIERLDTLHFFTRENPQVVVSTTHVERCFGHGITATDLEGYASFATPDAAGLTYKEIQWSTDNIHFTTTVPTPATAVGTYHYYVRQSNSYYNFLDSVVCEGPVTDITYIVNPIPETPVVNDREDFYCVDASNGVHAVTVENHAVASTDCHLVWSKDRNFATTISGLELVPDITTAGVTTYYVYQVNDVTGCVGLDLDHVDSIKVTVYDNPVVATTVAPTFVCQGETIHVAVEPTVRGAVYTYAWTDGRTTAEFDTIPAVGNHAYTVSAFEAHTGLDSDKLCRTTVTTIQDTVNPNPVKPALNPASVDFCNETVTASTTYTMNATVGTYGNTCVWYNEAGTEIARGDSYEVNVYSIMASSNVDTTVTYSVKSYNSETGCWSPDADVFTFYFHTTPVLNEINSNGAHDSICPVAGIVNLDVTLATATTAPYTYTWSGSVAASTTNATVMNITTQCDSTYATSVYVTDKFGCVSTPKQFSIYATDHQPLTLNTYACTTNLYGCADSIIPAALTTAAAFEHSYAQVTNHCSDELTLTSVDAATNVDADNCVSTRVRTYTITDHCGNSVQFVETFVVRDTISPVIAITTPVVLPVVRVSDCKYDAPETAVLMNVLNGNLSDNCASVEFLTNSVEFYFSGTTNRFENAQDIFADASVNKVTVAAKITDRCGNSTTVDVIDFLRPAPMYIENGAAVSNYSYVCKQDPDMLNRDTVVITFDPDKIHNATAPYTYQWSQNPDEGYIADATAIQTVCRPTLAGAKYVYTMTVTDSYGCTYSVTTDSVEVNDVITVNINKNTLNGLPWSEPVCPNEMLSLVASCQAPGYWPASMFNFEWTHTAGTSTYRANNNIAYPVMPNNCGGTESYQVLATRHTTGCKAIGRVSVSYTDTVAPVIDIANVITEGTVSVQAGCRMLVPDFTPNLNASNTSDNCVNFALLTLTQEPAAGTVMTQNTPVVVTVTDPCGNSTPVTFMAKVPANFLSVTADASNYAFCEDTVVTLTATPAHYYGTVTYAWTEGTTAIGTANPQTVTPTADADEVQHDYVVVVTDGNGCTAADTVSVVTYRKPVAADINLTSVKNTYCNDGSGVYDGSISTTMSEGFQYRINAIAADWHPATYTYQGLPEGNYNVDVMTNHGCIVNNLASVEVLRDTLETVYAVLNQTPNTSCVRNNGIVTVTNLAAGYSYTLNGITVVNDNNRTSIDYTDLSAGIYTLTVVTPKHCEYQKTITVLDNMYYPQAADITLVPQANSYCDNASGIADGSIACTALAYGYQYKMHSDAEWHNAAYVYNNLYQGNYAFDVISNLGCISSNLVNVTVQRDTTDTEYALVSTNANTRCAAPYNGVITLNNVKAGYTYTMGTDARNATDNSAISYTDLYFGTYTINVVTDKYCEYTLSATVDSAAVMPVRPHDYNNPQFDCGRPNGTLALTDGGVVEGYRYELLNVLPTQIITADAQDTISFVALSAGTYSVRITTPMACTAVFDGFVVEGNMHTPADPTTTILANNACNPALANGSITITDVHNQYTYVLKLHGVTIDSVVATNTSNITFNNLLNETYDLNVYSEVSCMRHTVRTVPSAPIYPTFAADEVVVNPRTSCSVANGTLAINRVNGYNYEVKKGGVVVTNYLALDAGDYVVYKTSVATGCVSDTTVTIGTSYYVSEYTVTPTHNSWCDGVHFDGALTFTNTDSLTFTITDAALNDVTVNNGHLAAGTYSVSAVNRFTGCPAANHTATITDDNQVLPSARPVTTANHICFNLEGIDYDGTVSFYPANNGANIEYYVVEGDTNMLGYFEHFTAGTYNYTLISDKGCVTRDQFIVVDSAFVPDMTVTHTDNYACAPIWVVLPRESQKTLAPGNGSIRFTSPLDIAHADHYIYKFKDTLPQLQWVDAAYLYLDANTYKVQVIDTYTQCRRDTTIVIGNDYRNVNVNLTATDNDVCVGAFNGTITATLDPTYASSVYTYSLDGAPAQMSNVFTGLASGRNYAVSVLDTTIQCRYTANVTVDKHDYEYIFSTSDIVRNTICSGTPNGQITVNLTGANMNPNAQLTYSLNGGSAQTSNVFSNLAAGDYVITVMDTTTGCTYDTTLTVTNDFTYPTFALSATHNGICRSGEGDATISFVPATSYNYVIYKGAVSPATVSINGQLQADTYTVRATDPVTNCYKDQTIVVTDSLVYPHVVATSTPDYLCTGDNGTVTLSVDNIADACSFTLTGFTAQSAISTYTFNNVSSGTKNYTVKSSKGCLTNGVVTVLDSAHIYNVDITTTPDFTCTNSEVPGTGSITFDVTNPAGHTYLGIIAPNDTAVNNIFDNLYDGNHLFLITDLNTGCFVTKNATVKDSSYVPSMTLASTPDTNCTYPYNGTITVAASSDNANANFKYSINNGISYQNEAVFTGLNVGKYGVTVKDANVNCTFTDSVVVSKYDYIPSWNIASKANYSCVSYNGALTINFNNLPVNHTYNYSIDSGAHYQASNIFMNINNSGTTEGYNIAVKDMTTGCVYNTHAEVIDSSDAPQVVIASLNHTKTPFRYCYGTSDAMLQAIATSTIPGDDTFTYRWNNDCWYTNSTTAIQSLNGVHVGTCTDTVWVTSSLTGCTTMKVQKIYVDSLPVVRFFVDGLPVLSTNNFYNSCQNDPHQICIEPTALDSIQWNAAAGMARTRCIDITSMPVATDTTFCVMIWDNHGCRPSESASITMHYMDTNHVAVYDTMCAMASTPYIHNGKSTPALYVAGTANLLVVTDTLLNIHGCDSIVTYYVTLQGAPAITVNPAVITALNASHCPNDVILASGAGYQITDGGSTPTHGWRKQVGATKNVDTDPIFFINNALTYADNNTKVYAYVKNNCSTAYSNVYTLKVSDVPTNVTINPTTLYCHGVNFGCGTVTFNANNSNSTDRTITKQWQKSADQVTWTDVDSNFVVNYADNDSYVRVKVTNCCGSAYSTPTQLVVDTMPAGVMTVAPTTLCDGHQLTNVSVDIAHESVTAPVSPQLYLGTTPISSTYTFTYADNGKSIYYHLTNRCNLTGTNTNSQVITVNDVPAVNPISVSSNLCRESYSIVAPTYDLRGGTLLTTTWNLYDNATGGTAQTIASTAIASVANSGKYLAYAVTNSCGTTESARLQLVVKDKPVLSATISNQTVCQGTAVNVGSCSVSSWNNCTGTANYRIKPASGSWRNWSNNDTLQYGTYKVAFVAQNDCGTVSTDTVDVTVNDEPLLSGTLSPVNTCAGAVTVANVTVSNWRHATHGTSGYKIRSYNGSTWSSWSSWTNGSILPYGNYEIKYEATNGCGTATAGPVTVTINDVPTLSGTLSDYHTCKGAVTIATISVSNWRHATPGTSGYKIRSYNGSTWSSWSSWTNGSNLTYGNYQIKYEATNDCGTVTAGPVNIRIDDIPILSGTLSSVNTCPGPVTVATVSVSEWRHPTEGTAGYQIRTYNGSSWSSWSSWTNGSTLAYGNYQIKYEAMNGCGTATAGPVNIRINDKPLLSGTLAAVNTCEGAVTVATVSVSDWRHTTSGTSGYKIRSYNGSSWSSWSDWTNGSNLAYGNYQIKYEATNGCGTATAGPVNITINATPILSGNLSSVNTCEGPVTVATVSVSNWRHTTEGTAGYKIRSYNGSSWSSWSSWTNGSNLAYGNYQIKYEATNGCGTVTKGPVAVTINAVPTLTGTLSDDTICSGSVTVATISVSDWRHTTSGTSGYKIRSYNGSSWSSWSSWTNGSNLDYGIYQIKYEATNACGTATEGPVTLTINAKPILSGTLSSVNTCEGPVTVATVSVSNWRHTTEGTAGYKYSSDNGSSWNSWTNGSNLAYDNYQIKYEATNGCGTATAGPVAVTINAVPTLTGTLSDVNTCAGAVTVATVNVSNWRHSSTLGRTSGYRIKNNADNTWSDWTNGSNLAYGTYKLAYVATNSCGSVSTDTVTLTIKDKPTRQGASTLASTYVCDGVATDFTAPTVNWHNSVGTAKFQVKVGYGAYVDTTATMTFAYGTTYQVRYVASNDCATDEVIDGPVTISVVGKPSFTLAPIANVCYGNVIATTMPLVELKGGTATDTTWTIGTEAFNAATLYTPGDYSINLAVTNECGTTTQSQPVTVYALPVPHILGDTTICESGTAVITATPGFVTYQWNVNGTPAVGATAQTFNYTSATSGVDAITVTVTDAHGCASTENVNDDVDVDWGYYQANAVTVKVSNDPHFVFRDANGNETHRLPAIVTSTTDLTNYSWTVADPCGTGGERIFVTFELYHNGQLIDTTGNYFNAQSTNGTPWINKQVFSYNLDASHVNTFTMLYNVADYHNTSSGAWNLNTAGNHFPFYSFSGYQFDYIYLHLLSSRYVNTTMAPVITSGEYKFVYKMWRVDNHSEIPADYYDPASHSYRRVGGVNSNLYSNTLLISDSLMLTVTGEQLQPVAPSPAPAPAADEPSMSIYPNPTSDNFTAVIDGLEGNATVTIANNIGNVVFQETINIDQEQGYIYTHSMNDVQPGIYYVQIVAENGRITKKVVVAR